MDGVIRASKTRVNKARYALLLRGRAGGPRGIYQDPPRVNRNTAPDIRPLSPEALPSAQVFHRRAIHHPKLF